MTTQTKFILTPSFLGFCLELEQAILDGYRIDQSDLPSFFMQYEANLVKVADEDPSEEKKPVGRPRSK